MIKFLLSTAARNISNKLPKDIPGCQQYWDLDQYGHFEELSADSGDDVCFHTSYANIFLFGGYSGSFTGYKLSIYYNGRFINEKEDAIGASGSFTGDNIFRIYFNRNIPHFYIIAGLTSLFDTSRLSLEESSSYSYSYPDFKGTLEEKSYVVLKSNFEVTASYYFDATAIYGTWPSFQYIEGDFKYTTFMFVDPTRQIQLSIPERTNFPGQFTYQDTHYEEIDQQYYINNIVKDLHLKEQTGYIKVKGKCNSTYGVYLPEKIIQLKPNTVYTYYTPNAEIKNYYKSPETNDSIPGWGIALIVIGCIIVVGAIAFCVYYFVFRNKSDNEEKPSV